MATCGGHQSAPLTGCLRSEQSFVQLAVRSLCRPELGLKCRIETFLTKYEHHNISTMELQSWNQFQYQENMETQHRSGDDDDIIVFYHRHHIMLFVIRSGDIQLQLLPRTVSQQTGFPGEILEKVRGWGPRPHHWGATARTPLSRLMAVTSTTKAGAVAGPAEQLRPVRLNRDRGGPCDCTMTLQLLYNSLYVVYSCCQVLNMQIVIISIDKGLRAVFLANKPRVIKTLWWVHSPTTG